VRPDYKGLFVDPCIPTVWDGFSVTRRFRGQVFKITVHNPEHVSKGVMRVVVDGGDIKGNIIPADLSGTTHSVEVWLGKRE
jgi:cellobiose phosphorylase